MNYKELLNKVNSTNLKAELREDSILVYRDKDDSEILFTIENIMYDYPHLVWIPSVSLSDTLIDIDIIDYIHEFMHTNKKDRFPEQKYNVVIGTNLIKCNDTYIAYSKEEYIDGSLLHNATYDEVHNSTEFLFTESELKTLYTKIDAIDPRLSEIAKRATHKVNQRKE